jgi:hypothetical protein
MVWGPFGFVALCSGEEVAIEIHCDTKTGAVKNLTLSPSVRSAFSNVLKGCELFSKLNKRNER